MSKELQIRNSTAEFLIFQAEDKAQGVQVFYKDETIWASQKAIAALFDCSTDNVSLHLKNIFESGELDKDSVTEKISATASDGKIQYVQKLHILPKRTRVREIPRHPRPVVRIRLRPLYITGFAV